MFPMINIIGLPKDDYICKLWHTLWLLMDPKMVFGWFRILVEVVTLPKHARNCMLEDEDASRYYALDEKKNPENVIPSLPPVVHGVGKL